MRDCEHVGITGTTLILMFGSMDALPVGRGREPWEHSPTVAQCQANQRLWLSKIGEGRPANLPTFDVLTQLQKEMDDCIKVDPSSRWKYYNVMGKSLHKVVRMIHLMDRHGLSDKFLEEDAAGKR